METQTPAPEPAPETAAELLAAFHTRHFDNFNDFVRDTLRFWQANHKAEDEEMRRLVQESFDSGPGLDAEEVFARLEARFGRPSDA